MKKRLTLWRVPPPSDGPVSLWTTQVPGENTQQFHSRCSNHSHFLPWHLVASVIPPLERRWCFILRGCSSSRGTPGNMQTAQFYAAEKARIPDFSIPHYIWKIAKLTWCCSCVIWAESQRTLQGQPRLDQGLGWRNCPSRRRVRGTASLVAYCAGDQLFRCSERTHLIAELHSISVLRT